MAERQNDRSRTLPGRSYSMWRRNENGQIRRKLLHPAQGLYGRQTSCRPLGDGIISDLGTLGGPGAIAFGLKMLDRIVGSREYPDRRQRSRSLLLVLCGGIGGGNSGTRVERKARGVVTETQQRSTGSNNRASPIGGGGPAGRGSERTRGESAIPCLACSHQTGVMTDLKH